MLGDIVMLDKIQKFLGCPDRISTIWYLLTVPSCHVLLFYSMFDSSTIIDIILFIFMLNFILFLKYTARVDKSL